MQPIWHEEVAPKLRELVEDEVTITRNIKTLGMSEAAIDEEISEFFGLENPYLGIYSKADGIHLRIIARARDEDVARQMIVPVEAAITERLGTYIWGYDSDSPEQAAGQALRDAGLTLATMESCSGGFLANSITDIPDSTGYYKGGIIAFNSEMLLAGGVSDHVLEKHGLVSPETAMAMAHAARDGMAADYGIAITGVIGPEPVEEQPVGQVFVAIVGRKYTRELQFRTPPRRIVIKRRVANTALTELRKLIATENED